MNWRKKADEVQSLEDLKQLKSSFYAKDSEFGRLKRQIAHASSLEEKRALGQQANKLREEAEDLFRTLAVRVNNNSLLSKASQRWYDVGFPTNRTGGLHPVSIIKNRFRDWLTQNGYFELSSSEIVSDEYNFSRLNMGPEHPARNMHDSLYFDANRLLRTHNTCCSALALTMFKNKEFGQFSIGKVYRNDTEDQTHSHQFQQVDILFVSKDASLVHLIWTLKSLFSYVLEEEVQLRLRPSFFPFTTPSLEVDIFLRGKWIEILGSGMVHPEVLRLAGYTDTSYKGFAAGIGIERVAMVKYQVSDLREFFLNDFRFLKQFSKEEV